jgi:hypothetical protein
VNTRAITPMALPVPVDGELCGSALEAGLNDVAVDYTTAFGLDQQLSEDGDAGGCAGFPGFCFPRTYYFNSHTTCTQWGPWSPRPRGCIRFRTCTDHRIKVRVKLNCDTITTPISGAPYSGDDTKPHGPNGEC